MTFKYIAGGAAALVMTSTTAFALSVTPSDDANTLAASILGTGVTINSATYTGGDVASGTFSDGDSSGINIDEGLILTTGNAVDAIGPNSSDSLSVDNGAAGFSGNSFNASVLEIEFESETGDLFFDYVFASEEYNEFTNTLFNDKFFFLISGPGIVGDENIALIPGTTTPVEINTVNGGGPIFGQNPSNDEFFNNNDLNDGGPFFDIEYDGFTDVFTAKAEGLTIG